MWKGGMTGWATPSTSVNRPAAGSTTDSTTDMTMEEETLLRSGEYVRKYSRRFWILLAAFCVLLGFMIVLSVFFYLSIEADKVQDVTVVIEMGTIQGKIEKSPQGVNIDEFLGIPYAQPPIDDLRFSNPQPLKQLPMDPYSATDYKSSCVQHLEMMAGTSMLNPKDAMKEDCLYLNVWVPREEASDLPLKNVIVLIYGEGFYRGSSDLELNDGKVLAAETGAIVVSFNYRVGVLGFFSTGDGTVSGNFGLKDQVAALKWVRKHIVSFSGNPQAVTIIGDGAGGASIGYHLISSDSNDLFHRAVFQSGSTISQWAFMSKKEAAERANALAHKVNCSSAEKSFNLLSCLRDIPLNKLLKYAWASTNFMLFPWVPTVDDEYLHNNPFTLLQAGDYPKKDTMLGFNKDEGTYWVIGYQLPGFSLESSSTQSHEMFLDAVNIMDWDLDNATRVNITREYSPVDKTDGAANRDAVIAVAGDRSFGCPTKQLATWLSGMGGNTYMYYLTYRPHKNVWPEWAGVTSTAEVQWTLGLPLDPTRMYTKHEEEFSKTIMTYLKNFVATGNPNDGQQTNWPSFNPEKDGDKAAYLEWKAPNDFKAGQGLKEQNCQMWNTINEEYFTDIIYTL